MSERDRPAEPTRLHPSEFGEQHAQTYGPARVWIGPEPPRGAHSSYLGEVICSPLGVHVPAGSYFNHINLEEHEDERWPMGSYLEAEHDELVPWHRVHLVEWLHPDETVEGCMRQNENARADIEQRERRGEL
jgi:hypothetical protein